MWFDPRAVDLPKSGVTTARVAKLIFFILHVWHSDISKVDKREPIH